MTRKYALISLCTLASTACAHADPPEPQAQTRTVGAFNSVELSGHFDADITVGGTTQVIVEGDPDVLEHVFARVRQGQLEIGIDKRRLRRDEVKLTVVTPTLRRLESNGATWLSVAGAQGEALDVELNGSTQAEFQGDVDRFAVEINGSGVLDSSELKAAHVQVEINGSGHAHVMASERVDAEINGSGRVQYSGKPSQVAKSVHGIGWIRAL